MSHIVTDLCIKCMSCPPICPVTCIHPMEGEPQLDDVPQVFINPDECIDCGACAGTCPVSAIFPEGDLPADKQDAIQANTKFFQ